MRFFVCLIELFFSLSILAAPPERFDFITKLPADRLFVRNQQSVIEEKALTEEQYWGVKPNSPVRVEIFPFLDNPTFLNCARIYGVTRIYIHSPESLTQLPAKQRSKVEPFCLKKTYSDLASTVAHEYSHVLHSLYLKGREHPLKWIWEGAAVYLSGQLSLPLFSTSIQHALKDFESIDLCNAEPKGQMTYQIGVLAIAYYEAIRPKVLLDLASASSPSQVAQVLKKYGLSCTLNREMLLANYAPK